MKKIILLFVCGIMLFTFLGGVTAIASYCGDGVCTTFPQAYSEADATSDMYCPADCGILTDSLWCQNTYRLIPNSNCQVTNCETPRCTIYNIPTNDLTNWCTSTGYSKLTTPYAISSGTNNTNSEYNWIFWIVFLAVGFIIGYYYKSKSKKRR
jgi:hypothetical protein